MKILYCRYVDPNLEVQEVVYSSDDNGFHAEASNIPVDTAVVAQAKTRHQSLFEKISEEHARIGEEHRLKALLNKDKEDDDDNENNYSRYFNQNT